MSEEERKVATIYGGNLRVRICGLLRRPDGALLCALHRGVGERGMLWIPPGGGLHFGETVADCLRREYLEETGLAITPGPLFTWHEHVAPPIHALELFFEVQAVGSMAFKIGTDPEWPYVEFPVLADLAWIRAEDVAESDLFHRVVLEVLKIW